MDKKVARVVEQSCQRQAIIWLYEPYTWALHCVEFADQHQTRLKHQSIFFVLWLKLAAHFRIKDCLNHKRLTAIPFNSVLSYTVSIQKLVHVLTVVIFQNNSVNTFVINIQAAVLILHATFNVCWQMAWILHRAQVWIGGQGRWLWCSSLKQIKSHYIFFWWGVHWCPFLTTYLGVYE